MPGSLPQGFIAYGFVHFRCRPTFEEDNYDCLAVEGCHLIAGKNELCVSGSLDSSRSGQIVNGTAHPRAITLWKIGISRKDDIAVFLGRQRMTGRRRIAYLTRLLGRNALPMRGRESFGQARGINFELPPAMTKTPPRENSMRAKLLDELQPLARRESHSTRSTNAAGFSTARALAMRSGF